ncbi:hypothetical protein ACFQIA_15930 [Halalkalicoccus sp. GCM10025704]
MRTLLVTAWILCLLAAVGGATVVAGPVAASDHTGDGDENPTQTIEIDLEADGDAAFSVRKRFTLGGDEEREAFDRLAREFESGEADGEFSATVFERIAERASEKNGREMAIEDVSRETRTSDNAGTLELRFRWTNFAATPEDTIEVGDALTIDGEPWLPSLSADQRLIIRAPENYAVENARPEASVEPGTVVWEGPQQFEPGQPTATLVPSSRTNEDFSALTVGLGLALVAAIVLLVYLLSQRRSPTLPSRGDGGERGWSALIAPPWGTAARRRPNPPGIPNPSRRPIPTIRSTASIPSCSPTRSAWFACSRRTAGG